MPEFDGLDVLEASKQMDLQTMVFILTAYADFDSAVESIRFGVDYFLLKTFAIN